VGFILFLIIKRKLQMSSLKKVFDIFLHDAEKLALESLMRITSDHAKTKMVFDTLKNAQCRKFAFHNWENVLLCVKFIHEVVACPHMRDKAIVATLFKDYAFNPFSSAYKLHSAHLCFDLLFEVLSVNKGLAEEIKHSILKVEPPKERSKKLTDLDKAVIDVSFIRLASAPRVFWDITKLLLKEKGLPENQKSFDTRARWFRQNFPLTLSRSPVPIFLSPFAEPYEAMARVNVKGFLLACKAGDIK
jgi:hypothetical protein